MTSTSEKIERLIRDRFAPLHLALVDESVHHVGHAGAASGGGHYSLTIVSEAFSGKATLERHRLVHEILRDLLPREIHALALRTRTPEEWRRLRGSGESTSGGAR